MVSKMVNLKSITRRLPKRPNQFSRVKFICNRIKKRRKPRVKIVTLKLC
jgi:hypothetical protein